MGGKQALRGVIDGFSGIVTEPVREVRAGGGVVGGLKGFAVGTLRAIPKAYVGTTSGVTKALEGVRNSAGSVALTVVDAVRPPRPFYGCDWVLKPFDGIHVCCFLTCDRS